MKDFAKSTHKVLIGMALGLTNPTGMLANEPGTYEAVRYSDIQQKSIHNAYTQAESILDQLVYHNIRNMEWDIRSQPVSNIWFASPRADNDWYVYHSLTESRRCEKLSDCLVLLRAFHDAVPHHEVFTLTLEFKGADKCVNHAPTFFYRQDLTDPTRQTPAGLDARLRAQLGDALFTPADLLASCPGEATLQGAVSRCGWPTLDELRGKIIVHVLAYNEKRCDIIPIPGPSAYTEDALTKEYAADHAMALSRVAFVAPLSYSYGPIDTNGHIKDIDERPWIVSHTEVSLDRARFLRSSPLYRNHILRGPEANDEATFLEHQSVFNLINTDHISFDLRGWARTHNARGFPFCPIGVKGQHCWQSVHALSGQAEIRNALEVAVASGDIDKTADNFVFASEVMEAESPAQLSWTALIASASNKDVQEWAKGCLMARESLTADSAYYAVCRAGDDKELFIQFRKPSGAGTARAEARLGRHGFDGEDAAFVRLDIQRNPDQTTTVLGYGSANGKDWEPIGSPQVFSATLSWQGLAASSHRSQQRNPDGSLTRFLFTNVALNGIDRTADIQDWDLMAIGDVKGGSLIQPNGRPVPEN